MYKVSWIKGIDDNSFKIFKSMGLDVFELDDLEKTDEKIKELKDKKYNVIVLSNLAASNSRDIITKYQNDKDINIIISPLKK